LVTLFYQYPIGITLYTSFLTNPNCFYINLLLHIDFYSWINHQYL